MKTLELSDETHAALLRLAAERQISPAEALTLLLHPDRPQPIDRALLAFLASPEFAAAVGASDRYLALLGWTARNCAHDFADFISHQESGRRYLMLDRDEMNEVRSHHHARPLEGTPYWAVMAIDEATKRRFVGRLLEYIGCHDATIAQARQAVGLDVTAALGQELIA